MKRFTPSQRWINDNDASLGLGIVQSVDSRTVQVEFPAADETRTFAINNAPLTRVEFSVGDSIKSIDGWSLAITEVEQVKNTLRYHGTRDGAQRASLHECELCDEISFNLPQDRLFSGQTDDNSWFELRTATLRHLAELNTSPTYGLQGPRVSLIEHQIYIANEVSNRTSPRVLLADEVGLGKTIEAGLILHRLIVTGKIQRALIIVPEPLLHQWLVELLRRFNLRFALIDEQSMVANQAPEEDIDDQPPADNPFDMNSLVLCGLNFSCNEKIAPLVSACDWDMLIVDEAHHLEWSPQEASREYQHIETLANKADSVLLLTATPEQLGAEGHFARLRLLDPARFHSLDAFLAGEQHHTDTAELVNALIDNQSLDPQHLAQLQTLLGEDTDIDADSLDHTVTAGKATRQRMIDHLIDQHGTGRVLFRNTRANISGFPKRFFRPAELADDKQSTAIDWVAEELRDIALQKALLICASADTAIAIGQRLSRKHGVQAGLFHEHMSIIERDRAAAWFADTEDGARILICSEIGSEGRNFQFLHHMIMFDLPDNPDLLEQRIGRLDRIGQQQDISIHVPTAADTRGSRLAHWYHQALNAFEQSCVTGQYVQAAVGAGFNDYLAGNIKDEAAFIDTCKTLHQQKQEELDRGRNRLLELSACRKDVAQPLIEHIDSAEQTNTLPKYLEQAFDCFGVNIEDHSLGLGSWILKPSDHLEVEHFPELPEDGMTVTTRREVALAREDIHYLTWEHPMVRATIDLVINGDKGNVSICSLKLPKLPPRTILLEAIFEPNCPAPKHLGVERYISQANLRLLVDQRGKDLAPILKPHLYGRLLENIDREIALQMIDISRDTLKKQVRAAEAIAAKQLSELRAASISNMHEELNSELQRLITLQKRNPAIRDEEIEQLQQRIRALEERLSSADLKLSALRVIYAH